MNDKLLNKIRIRRARRVRAKIFGTNEKPRLSILRSNKYTYVQLIDDAKGQTIASASTYKLKKSAAKNKTEEAKELGNLIAEKAKEKGVNNVVFDRGRYKFHGRLKAILESLRESGIKV